jgi:hypothetical protein
MSGAAAEGHLSLFLKDIISQFPVADLFPAVCSGPLFACRSRDMKQRACLRWMMLYCSWCCPQHRMQTSA